MTIYDGSSSTSSMMGKYCGDSIPPSHVSSSNEILVHFQSDEEITYTGFKMKYNPLGNTKFKTTLNTMGIIRVVFISRWVIKNCHFPSIFLTHIVSMENKTSKPPFRFSNIILNQPQNKQDLSFH